VFGQSDGSTKIKLQQDHIHSPTPKGPLRLSFNADVLEFYFPRLFTKLANFFRHPKKDPKTKTVFALILYDLIAKLPSFYN